jgi:hypothetical protein
LVQGVDARVIALTNKASNWITSLLGKPHFAVIEYVPHRPPVETAWPGSRTSTGSLSRVDLGRGTTLRRAIFRLGRRSAGVRTLSFGVHPSPCESCFFRATRYDAGLLTRAQARGEQVVLFKCPASSRAERGERRGPALGPTDTPVVHPAGVVAMFHVPIPSYRRLLLSTLMAKFQHGTVIVPV